MPLIKARPTLMLHQLAQDLVLLGFENLHKWRCQSLSGPLFQCSTPFPQAWVAHTCFCLPNPPFLVFWVQRSTARSPKLFLCLLNFQLTRWDTFCSVTMFWVSMHPSDLHCPHCMFLRCPDKPIFQTRQILFFWSPESLFYYLSSLHFLGSWLQGPVVTDTKAALYLHIGYFFFLPSLFLSNKSSIWVKKQWSWWPTKIGWIAFTPLSVPPDSRVILYSKAPYAYNCELLVI